MTFGPDGGYGHPDHVAISQLTTAAIVAAADPAFANDGAELPGPPIRYPSSITSRGRRRRWAAYQAAIGTLSSNIDGIERHAAPLPDWAITTTIDAREFVVDGGPGDRLPRVASRRLRQAERCADGTAESAVGRAIVLPRVQPRQRWTRP